MEDIYLVKDGGIGTGEGLVALLFEFKQRGIATRDNDLGRGILSSDAVYGLSVLMVRGVGDGAGVDDDEVRLFTGLDACVSLAEQLVHERTGLGEVKFAA